MIKTIIFDFGNVLIDLDIETTVIRLRNICGLEESEFREKLTPIFLQYEQGLIGDESLIWHFQQYNHEIEPREIVKAWNAMLLTIDDSVPKMLDKLNNDYTIYLLSNINGFHARNIDRYLVNDLKIPDFLSKYFEQIFYSHIIHMRKPQQRIYEYVTRKIGIQNLEEVLFIDDSLENVEAARSYGWKAIQHNPEHQIANKIFEYLNII